MKSELAGKANVSDLAELRKLLNEKAVKSEVQKEILQLEKMISEIKRMAISTEGTANKCDKECQ